MKTIYNFSAQAAKSVILSLVFWGVTACTGDFSEINWPYGGLTEEDLNGDNNMQGSILTALELAVVSQDDAHNFQHTESLTGDVWGRTLMCHPGGNNGKWSGDFSYFTYDGRGWVSNPFTGTMGFYVSYNNSNKFTEKNPANSNYALARILRVATMHRLADLYGPIPYSEVESGQLLVPYDDDDRVYLTMLEDLDTAIVDLEACIATGSCQPVAKFDRIYFGDYDKWLKYANSLMLRLAVRISNADPETARRYAEQAVRKGVIESNDESAMLHMQGASMMTLSNKLYDVVYSWSDSYACADLVCYMTGYEDPRLKKYFTTVTAKDADGESRSIYFGLRAGSSKTDVEVEANYSRPAVGINDDYPCLVAAEVAFLRAEGALKGWDMGADAKSLYERGIALSFGQWSVGGAEEYAARGAAYRQDDYVDVLNGDENCPAASTIEIAWSEAASKEKNLERIIVQKYIALYPLGHEVWCDYRRTGYPAFFDIYKRNKVAAEYSAMKVANRMPFSFDEYNTNKQNVTDACRYLPNGVDNFAAKLWWAKQ